MYHANDSACVLSETMAGTLPINQKITLHSLVLLMGVHFSFFSKWGCGKHLCPISLEKGIHSTGLNIWITCPSLLQQFLPWTSNQQYKVLLTCLLSNLVKQFLNVTTCNRRAKRFIHIFRGKQSVRCAQVKMQKHLSC